MSVAVIGGGPAGAAAAAAIARAGRAVTLFEREPAPVDKVCGDFVSAEGVAAIEALGIDLDRLDASLIDRVRLVSGRVEALSPLPFVARGLSRRALDAALVEAAENHGARLRREPVRAFNPGPPHRLVGPDVEASDVLLATGKHRLRGTPVPERPGDLIGLKTYVQLAPAQARALSGHVEIVLYEGGYAGLQLVEHDRANLCLLTSGERVRAAGGTREMIETLRRVCPHLATRLDGASELLPRPLSIAGIAYGFVHRPSDADVARLYRLGDRAAVIPSLAGDGISIALHSGLLAAEAVLAGADARSYHTAIRRAVRRPVACAHALQVALEAGWSRALIGALAARSPRAMRLAVQATRLPQAA